MNTKIVSKNVSVAWPVLALAFCVACASPPKVRVDKDAAVNFAAYKTFAWLSIPSAPPKETPKPIAGKEEVKAPASDPQANSIMETRVRAAVVSSLQAKGYSPSETNPDFKVSYTLNVYERPKESGMRIGLGAGGGTGRVGGGVGLSIPIGKRTNTVGTMTIDIIDTARNAQVWTGTYEDLVATENVDDAAVANLVNTILNRFPTDKK
jgi:Domain of unknown function (DUF4136)